MTPRTHKRPDASRRYSDEPLPESEAERISEERWRVFCIGGMVVLVALTIARMAGVGM